MNGTQKPTQKPAQKPAQKSAQNSVQKPDNIELIAQSMKHLNQLAIGEIRQKNYKQAIDYFTQSLVLEEKLGLKVQMAESFYNIAGVYYLMEEYEPALHKIQLAETLFLQEKQKEAVVKTQEMIREIKGKMKQSE
ncbi:MAG: tetratricopeptide repeat protein [Methanimicrococcus sp.]|nr:tetratricopeptide repeat protein [Methanimicrococcus sp.]